MDRRRALATATLLAALVSAPTGCGQDSPPSSDALPWTYGPLPPPSETPTAVRDTAAEAALGIGLELDGVARTRPSVDDVVALVLTDREADQNVELLRTGGAIDGVDTSGGLVDLRIRGILDGDPTAAAESARSPSVVIRCYAYVLQPYGAEDPAGRPFTDGCAEATALPLPELPVDPSLVEADTARLEAALSGSGDPAAVLAELEAGGRTGLYTQVEVVDGIVAAVIGTGGPPRDCLLGTRTASGEVAVWSPQRVTMEAGEGGCDPSAAVHPVKTH